MNSAPKLEFVNSDPIAKVTAERPALIEPGIYEAVFVRRWTGYAYGRAPKLALIFRVTTFGAAFGKKVIRWYNIKKFNSKRGDFQLGSWHCAYVREYGRLFGLPHNIKHLGISAFRNKIFLLRVRTVDRDHHQKSLNNDQFYSVVDEMLEVV